MSNNHSDRMLPALLVKHSSTSTKIYLLLKLQNYIYTYIYICLQCLHSTETSTFALWECTKWPNRKLSANRILVSISAGKLYQKINISLPHAHSVFPSPFLPRCMWGEKSLAMTVFVFLSWYILLPWDPEETSVLLSGVGNLHLLGEGKMCIFIPSRNFCKSLCWK